MIYPISYSLNNLQILSNFCKLPLEIWIYIFKIKYELEKQELNSENYWKKSPQLNIISLRSYKCYINHSYNLCDKIYKDSYKILNSLDNDYKFCNGKKNYYLKLLQFADFIGNWYPIIDSLPHIEMMKNIKLCLDDKINLFYHNIFENVTMYSCCEKHYRFCCRIIEDIYSYIHIFRSDDYDESIRNNYKQYYYHYNYYNINHTVLRNGKSFPKISYDNKEKVILHSMIEL
jgi:hypothetical protein